MKDKEPDYKGFVEHVQAWDNLGIPWGTSDLVELARLYGTPIPERKDGHFIWFHENEKK